MTFAPFAKSHINLSSERVPREDAARQERTAEEILRRLERQPGVVLADEVGMGKTFVAMAVATSIILDREGDGPVVVMVPRACKASGRTTGTSSKTNASRRRRATPSARPRPTQASRFCVCSTTRLRAASTSSS